MNQAPVRGQWLDNVPALTRIVAVGLILIRLIASVSPTWRFLNGLFLGPVVPAAGFPVVFLVALGLSVAFLAGRWRNLGRRAAQPLLILAVALLIWTVLPRTVIVGRLLLNQNSYERIVDAVAAGRMVPDEYGLLVLPSGSGPGQGKADQILVEGQGDSLAVLFLTSRGAAGGFEGYMYGASDTVRPNDPGFVTEPIREHWRWVESR